jgi:hypothetical protein
VRPRYDGLRKYLEAKRRDQRGWASDYEKQVCGGEVDWPYLVGHYSVLLDDTEGPLPSGLIDAALAAFEEVEGRRGPDVTLVKGGMG